jgi:hypothetical protein
VEQTSALWRGNCSEEDEEDLYSSEDSFSSCSSFGRSFLSSSREIIIKDSNFGPLSQVGKQGIAKGESGLEERLMVQLDDLPDELKVYIMSFMDLPTISATARINKQ